MTKSNNKWVPDVGQKTQFDAGRDFEQFSGEITAIGRYYALVDVGKETEMRVKIEDLCPIKTEAEKRRESQIARMSDIMFEAESTNLVEVAEKLYDAGCQITKPLTDTCKSSLAWRFSAGEESFKVNMELIDALLNRLGIEP